MQHGRVYRRQDLDEFSPAVDRDLKTLIQNGSVRKLAYGLYCRKHPIASKPLAPRELVRAFLKTKDFLLMPHGLVYNHKRSGDILLDGNRLTFRLVPAYPKKTSWEYIFVDRINKFKRRPDNAALFFLNLQSRVNELDQNKLRENLERYGRPAAKAVLKRVTQNRRANMPLRVVVKEDARADLRYWLKKSPAERVEAVEFLREQYYALSGHKTLPRLAHVVRVVPHPA